MMMMMISQKLMQLGSPNMTYKCSIVRPGNPWLGSKVKRKENEAQKNSAGVGFSTLVSAGFFSFTLNRLHVLLHQLWMKIVHTGMLNMI